MLSINWQVLLSNLPVILYLSTRKITSTHEELRERRQDTLHRYLVVCNGEPWSSNSPELRDTVWVGTHGFVFILNSYSRETNSSRLLNVLSIYSYSLSGTDINNYTGTLICQGLLHCSYISFYFLFTYKNQHAVTFCSGTLI